LLVYVIAGVTVGVFLLYQMLISPIVSQPIGQHIEYVSPHFFVVVTMSLYLLSTTLSPIFSSHRMVNVFGVVALLSAVAAYYFYVSWFISVWCFFAALLSVVIYFHFKKQRSLSASFHNQLA